MTLGFLVKKQKKELASEIVDCSGVSFEVAYKWRVHNYLWAGIDIYLLKENFQFVQKIVDLYKEIDKKEVSSILSKCFEKKRPEVERMINYHFGTINPEDLLSLEGLVLTWEKGMAGLPEKDKIKRKKTKLLFEEIYISYQGKWKEILEKVTHQVKENLRALKLL